MSLNKKKCDPELGLKIRKHLTNLGVETPMVQENMLPVKDRINIIEKNFTSIMETLGLDLNDDSLCDTPNRVAKMYVSEIFYGLDWETFPKITVVDNKFEYDEMIKVNNINLQSNCEHHFVIISGSATVAYLPGKKVIGLSKINRVVEYFSKRPQIQERLTSQIFHTLCYLLETDNVAVTITGTHYCVKSRGVEDINSTTTTSKLGGAFKNVVTTRAEFLSLDNRGG